MKCLGDCCHSGAERASGARPRPWTAVDFGVIADAGALNNEPANGLTAAFEVARFIEGVPRSVPAIQTINDSCRDFMQIDSTPGLALPINDSRVVVGTRGGDAVEWFPTQCANSTQSGSLPRLQPANSLFMGASGATGAAILFPDRDPETIRSDNAAADYVIRPQQAHGISNNGYITGVARRYIGGGDFQTRGFIRTLAGDIVDTDLIDDNGLYIGAEAQRINNAGLAVGNILAKGTVNGPLHAFILRRVHGPIYFYALSSSY